MKRLKTILFVTCFAFSIIADKYALSNELFDSKGCHSVELTSTNVSCYSLSDGSANLNIIGGSGNFSITWSTGAEDVYSITDLPAGIYHVNVLDTDNQCIAIDVVVISEPNALETLMSVSNVNCHGEESGEILLNVLGGTTPYSFVWSNSATTQNNLELGAGNYSVTVTDNNDCVNTNEAEVLQPEMELNSSYEISEVLCHNDSNGAINVSVWGGTPPYTFNWNNNEYFIQNLNSISAGTYELLIKDGKNCENTHNIILGNPELLEISGSATDNLCYGQNFGQIEVTPTGGTPPYSYTWANPEFILNHYSGIVENLQNNHYYVTVSDNNNCIVSDEFEITSPDAIVTEITGTNVSSFGGNDGQIYLSVEGGVPPYSFNWSNGVDTQDNLNVTAGTYDVTITDSNSCNEYESFVISEPSEQLLFSHTIINVTCNGGDDGEIHAHPEGGVPPYTYSWSTGSTMSNISNLHAGTYVLTLTDANMVEYVDTMTVSQPDPFVFTYLYSLPSCHGFSDGSIYLSVEGGDSPYSFSWYDNDSILVGSNADLTNIQAGSYTVELIDNLGCGGNYAVNLNQPSQLELSINKNHIQCYGEPTGSITIGVNGGTPPYSYLWSNGSYYTSINDLNAGTYSLTVTDNNACTVSGSTVITQPEVLNAELFPFDISCLNQSDGHITSQVSGGSGGYQYLWSTEETNPDIYDLAEGTYSLTVTDIFGCAVEKTAEIITKEVSCLNIPNTFTPNGTGINDEWVIRNIHLYPDCLMQVFNSWGQLVFESKGYTENWDGTYNGNPLPAGTYYYILSFSSSLETLTGTVTIIK